MKRFLGPLLAVGLAWTALPAHAKPPAPHATESATLQKAKAAVDKLTVKLAAMVKQAEAPDVDLDKIKTLVNGFQAHVASLSKETDALEAKLDEDDKANLGRYISEKVTPLLTRFQVAYARAEQAADPEREPRQQALLAAVEAAGKEAAALVAMAQVVGADPAKRAAVIGKLEPLQVEAHKLYHAGLKELKADAAREKWDGLFNARLELPLLRVERVLRMALQTPSKPYKDMQQKMADLTKNADALHGEWHAVQDWPALQALETRETAVRTAVQEIVSKWRLLPLDEAEELDAVARETLVPAMERMGEDAAQARKRLPAQKEP